jgi:hypothetical protein
VLLAVLGCEGGGEAMTLMQYPHILLCTQKIITIIFLLCYNVPGVERFPFGLPKTIQHFTWFHGAHIHHYLHHTVHLPDLLYSICHSYGPFLT